jgi:hypothetical protein
MICPDVVQKLIAKIEIRGSLEPSATTTEMLLEPRHAKKFFKPRSLDGWSLNIAVHLDAAAPGFLSFLICTSALRRQATLAALACLSHDEPESLAARLCPLISADCNFGHYPHEQIARALMIPTRAREIIRAVYGRVPDGFMGALHRLGDAPPPEPGLYRTLYDLFSRPENHFRAKALMQRSGALDATHIRIVRSLDPVLVHRSVLERIFSISQAENANAALALIRRTVSTATEESLRQSVESLGRKTDLVKFFGRWLERMDRPPALPPIPANDPDFRVLSTGELLINFGRQYRNCLRQKAAMVTVAASSYVAWLQPPGAVAELRRLTNGTYVLANVHGVANRRPDAALAQTIRQRLDSYGIPALSSGEGCPRVRDVLNFLEVWDFDGFGFNDPDDLEDGPAALNQELDEAANAT